MSTDITKKQNMPQYVNRKLYLLCRCTKRKYAEELFYQGVLFFNYPINWIGMGEDGDEGQGDPYEGVYSNVITEKNKRLRPDSEVVMIKGKPYLRSKSIVEKWPCLSFYSVSELTEGKEENGGVIYNMAKDYIESFCKGETFESMLRKPLMERMTMIVFGHTDRFISRVRGFFGSLGLKEHEDFFLNTVNYREKGAPFVIEKAPQELLSKDARFRNQQEFRIILNPNNPIIQNLLKDGQKIKFGQLRNCATLQTNFYDGAAVKVYDEEGKLSIKAVNQNKWTGPLNEWTLAVLLPVMQLAYHTTKCKVDGKEVGIDVFWREVTKVLERKYAIKLFPAPFDDQRDDEYALMMYGDSLDTIMKNELMDSCYYNKEVNGYTAPVFEELYGGWPSGLVNFSAVERKKQGA